MERQKKVALTKLKQHNKHGCGQTCVAMVAGNTEDFVCGLLNMRGKTHYDDLSRALLLLGFKVRHISFRSKIRRLPKYCIVLLKHKTVKSWGHWIVVQDDWVFDPDIAAGPFTLTQYEKDHMLNIRYVGYLEITGEPRGNP
jgi:hypothetical protein